MKVLHINASPRGAESQSLDIAKNFLSELSKTRPLVIDQLDLFDAGLPAFGAVATGAKMALFTGRDQTEEEIAAWADIRAVFDRFANAELYVLNAPIWNNGVPYILKQYIDLVTQPGWSFGFDPETGYSGLMTGRKAVLVQASGVWHQDVGPNFGSDFSKPFLQDWLNFVGIEDVKHLSVQPTVLNADFASTRDEARRRSMTLATEI